jgi:biopolymer transport protein ExbD
MSRFRKTAPKTVPSLNTAALPDLIFTLLFFFLLVANMRSAPNLTQFQIPNAVELQKLKEKSLLIYIMVGKAENATPENDPVIQLNSGFTSLEELPAKIESAKNETSPENRDKILVVMKIDKSMPMGLVNDIRKALREANLLTVFYAAEKKL